jgi:hypothetical protein
LIAALVGDRHVGWSDAMNMPLSEIVEAVEMFTELDDHREKSRPR